MNTKHQSKHRLGTVLAFVLSAAILIASVVYATIDIDDEIRSKEEELEQSQQQLQEINENLSLTIDILNEVNIKIYQTNEKISGIEGEIRSLSNDIRLTEGEILKKQLEIGAAEEEMKRLEDLLYKRLRVMYKAGTVGYLEVLFGADSMQELLSRADILQRIVEQDQELIDDLETHKLVLQNKRKDLEYKKEHLEDLLGQRLAKKAEQDALLNDLFVYYQQVEQDISALEEQAAIKMREQQELTELIHQLELSKEAYVGGSMAWPVPSSYEISSPYGPRPELVVWGAPYFHTGVDIAAPLGDAIVAAQSGTVKTSDLLSGYGYTVMIDHGGGIVTLYAHMNAIYVEVGQEVTVGETIGEIGSTGISTGPHLHFEVRVEGEPTEPLEYIGQYVGW